MTDGRYTVDPALERADRGRLLQSFVFEITLGERTVTLVLRDGFVTEEFIDLAGRPDRTAQQESRLDELKAQLAARVMAQPADKVYDVAD